MRSVSHTRLGFTLVELLVVIGIIALLISILLPSLNKARESAVLVADQSNFRQIFQAVTLYANANKGNLPIAAAAWSSGVTGTNSQITFALNTFLGGKEIINDTHADGSPARLSPVFKCALAIEGPGNVWASGVIQTMKWNPRAFPGADQVQDNINKAAMSPPQAPEWPQRKLSSIKNASEKIAAWEGAQLTDYNLCTEPTGINLDGWQWSWGHMYADPPVNSYALAHMNEPIYASPNQDGSGWFSTGDIRYRHIKSTRTPVVFFDGHVESRTAKDFLAKEICINRR